MLALDPNVTRQASQPFWREAAPQDGAEQKHHRADHDQEFSELAHDGIRLREVSGGTRLSLRWQCSLEIITKRSAFPKPRPTTKSGARFGNWRANIIPMSPRTKKPPKKNLSRSMKLTKS